MISIYLDKHKESGKLFVTKWEFIQKEMITKYPAIPGIRELLDEKDVPTDFFTRFHLYYYEAGKLRYASART